MTTEALTEFVDDKRLIDALFRDATTRPAPRTLAKWRAQPDGLPFTKIGGKVLYHIPTVRDWLMQRMTRPNPRRIAA